MDRRVFIAGVVGALGAVPKAASQDIFRPGQQRDSADTDDRSIFTPGRRNPYQRDSVKEPEAGIGGGCSLISSAYRTSQSQSENYFRNVDQRLSRLMRLETTLLKQAFNVNPGFTFYNDSKASNAMATPECLIANTGMCSGTVLFGLNLTHELIAELGNRLGQNAIIGVLAHEFAHIAQFNFGIHSGWTRNMELHADALAGWYVGAKHRWGVDMEPSGFFLQMYSIGDYGFWSSDHHGTPRERLAASIMGYELGTRGNAYRTSI